MFGYHVMFFQSLHYTTAINSSIINAMNPIITTILTGVFLKESIMRRQILGIIISFLGGVMTITGCDFKIIQAMSFNKGDILMFSAMVCFAVYGVFSRAKGKGIPPLSLIYYSFIFCEIALIPFVMYEKPWEFIADIPLEAWLSVLYMSIFASVIGYGFQQISIKKLGVLKTSVFINLMPFFTVILSVIILKETITVVKVISGLLIIVGVVICQLTGEKNEHICKAR